MLLIFSPSVKCGVVPPSQQPDGGGLHFLFLYLQARLAQSWSSQWLTCDFFENDTQRLLGMIFQSLLLWLHFNLRCSDTTFFFFFTCISVLTETLYLTRLLHIIERLRCTDVLLFDSIFTPVRNKIQRCSFL